MGEAPIEAWVELDFPDVETAHIVFQALSPDNMPLPQGLKLTAELNGSRITFMIICGRPMQSFLETVDDVLRMAALAEDMVGSIRKP